MRQFYLHSSKSVCQRHRVCKDVLIPTSSRPFPTMKMTLLQRFPENGNYCKYSRNWKYSSGGLAGGWPGVVLCCSGGFTSICWRQLSNWRICTTTRIAVLQGKSIPPELSAGRKLFISLSKRDLKTIIIFQFTSECLALTHLRYHEWRAVLNV